MIFLMCLEDIPDPGSRGFSVAAVEGFLVRRKDSVYAYRNRCPHVGAPLDWQPDQFLDPNARYIQCAMHGALFEMESGQCVQGPCRQGRLEPLPLAFSQDRIYLAADVDVSEGSRNNNSLFWDADSSRLAALRKLERY